MEKKLALALKPDNLEIINESHLHAGHQPGFDGKGESHMRVRIVSSEFIGKTRVARHRMVNEVLSEELRLGLHALAIDAKAPGE